ncbi:MAG: hypothetical protein H6502_05185 [Candidatus Woesearchaeota archaeon]|nr:MAG: hypothetical protein H6502_05185 [Candidatus Woesearchaeota archaeon]
MNTLKFTGKDPIVRGLVKNEALAKLLALKKLGEELEQDFAGITPNVFVEKHNYPNHSIGFLSTPSYNHNDDVKVWVAEKKSISDIVGVRARLVNSFFSPARTDFDKLKQDAQLATLSPKPVDQEINLAEKPWSRIMFKGDATPVGPKIALKSTELSHVRVPVAVRNIVDDGDLKASPGAYSLYKKYDNYFATKVFSLGNLGQEKRRRIVPTRWSITAVDNTLYREMIPEIRRNEISPGKVYFGGHLGNYFVLVFLPSMYRYELHEIYTGSGKVTDSVVRSNTDHEEYRGRKDYAEDTAGGYYAARLPIIEKLFAEKKQASVLALRFITSEYSVPLGVWVVREAVRNALGNCVLESNEVPELVKKAEEIIQQRFIEHAHTFIKQTWLFREGLQQKQISDY